MKLYTVENGVLQKGIKYSFWKQQLKGLVHLDLSTDNPPQKKWFNRIEQASLMTISKKGVYKRSEICKETEENTDSVLVKVINTFEISCSKWKVGDQKIKIVTGNIQVVDIKYDYWDYSLSSSHSGVTYKSGTMYKRESLLIIKPSTVVLIEDDFLRSYVFINENGNLTLKNSLRDYEEEKIPIKKTII